MGVKTMKQFLVFAFCVLFSATAFGQIKIQDTVEEYTPIVAEAPEDATLCLWTLTKTSPLLDPDNYPVPAHNIPEGNSGAVTKIWGEPGRYMIKLDSITIDWENKNLTRKTYVASFEIVARKSGPNPPPPPNPNPNPNPKPEPNVFKVKVEKALKKVDSSYISYSSKISEVYAGIAGEAKAQPNSWDAATMVNEAKVRNTTVLPTSALQGWAGFWPDLATAFKELNLTPDDLDGHIKAFEEVAEVLK